MQILLGRGAKVNPHLNTSIIVSEKVQGETTVLWRAEYENARLLDWSTSKSGVFVDVIFDKRACFNRDFTRTKVGVAV